MCIRDRLLQELPYKNILVDFHAEMTSEKKAMGYYLDGRVSAVLGTCLLYTSEKGAWLFQPHHRKAKAL